MWPRDAFVGQRVVATSVGDVPIEYTGPTPSNGTVYSVSWVGIDHEGVVIIDLAECPSPECENFYRGWFALDFKPVDESKLDVFRAMLEPLNADA